MSATSTSRSPSGNRPDRSPATPIPRRSSISVSCRATSTCRSDPLAESCNLGSVVVRGRIDEVVGEVFEPAVLRELYQSTLGDIVGNDRRGQQAGALTRRYGFQQQARV